MAQPTIDKRLSNTATLYFRRGILLPISPATKSVLLRTNNGNLAAGEDASHVQLRRRFAANKNIFRHKHTMDVSTSFYPVHIYGPWGILFELRYCIKVVGIDAFCRCTFVDLTGVSEMRGGFGSRGHFEYIDVRRLTTTAI